MLCSICKLLLILSKIFMPHIIYVEGEILGLIFSFLCSLY